MNLVMLRYFKRAQSIDYLIKLIIAIAIIAAAGFALHNIIGKYS